MPRYVITNDKPDGSRVFRADYRKSGWSDEYPDANKYIHRRVALREAQRLEGEGLTIAVYESYGMDAERIIYPEP
jgi:hypothetical protein